MRCIRFVTIFCFVASPLFAAAAGECPNSLVPCGCDTNSSGIVEPAEQCTFDHLIILAQNIINFLIFKIAAPIAAVMFAYAGFLYLTNRGDEGQVKRAHDVFTYVLIGLVIALAAWLVVNLIVTFFLDSSYILLSP